MKVVFLKQDLHYPLKRMQWHVHAQTHTQVNLSHAQNIVFSLFVLLLYISQKEKFFIEGFVIEHYMQEI